MKTKNLVLCAVFAAILAVLAVITVPIGPVPVTLGVLGVMLTAVVLGPKKGAVSVLIYLLIGSVGLPVFSGFKGGFAVLLGPTGGYAWSYILMALLIGALTVKLPENQKLAMLKIFAACILGVVICYAAGTVQFMAVQKTTLTQSLAMCVIPFIPFDIAKAVIAAIGGLKLSRTLKKAGFIDGLNKSV